MQFHKDVRPSIRRRLYPLWRKMAKTHRLIEMNRIGQLRIARKLKSVSPKYLGLSNGVLEQLAANPMATIAL